MTKRLTEQEFINVLKIKNPKFRINYSTYINMNVKAEFFYEEFKESFWKRPHDVVRGMVKFHPLHKTLNAKAHTEEYIKEKIKGIRKEIILKDGTYKGIEFPATFIHPTYGEFSRIVKIVLKRKMLNHPLECACAKSRMDNNVDSVIERIKKISPNLIMDKHSYKGINKKCKFWENGIEESFWTVPSYIINGGTRGHPKSSLKRREDNSLKKHGYKYPAQNLEIARKSAKSSTKCTILYHWKTNEELVCTAGYEPKVIEYLNKNKIDFHWQPLAFKLKNGKVYHVDMYLLDKNIYVEIKGYFRDNAKLKWLEFLETHPTAELWNEKKLKEMGIL